MARRQQLLGKLEEPKGGKRVRQPLPESQGTRYPPEVKAKAYAAFLDGASWSDCARAVGHKDPNGTGISLIQRWADDDHWQRPDHAGDYKAKVERERSEDPKRISDEVDGLCVKMQKVSETYIEQFFVEDEETGERRIVINTAFKTRDFADIAAALRMIHETRIKIRKSNEPKDGGDDGKKNDILSLIRDAGLARLRDNRRRTALAPLPDDDESDSEKDEPSEPAETPDRVTDEGPVVLPSFAEIRSRLESASGGSGAAEESLEADPGTDG